MSRKARRRELARRRARRRKLIPAVVLAVGVLLVAAGVYWYVVSLRTAEAALDFSPDDIVHEQPIVAVHEMGKGPPIPFLARSQPQPEVMVPERFHDFGVVGPTDVVERTFVIRNMGQGPLTISRAYTTCGCTTAEISASVIPPGKVATARLIFDAGFHDTAGQTVRRGLILENNDPNQSQAEIWIQATVRSS